MYVAEPFKGDAEKVRDVLQYLQDELDSIETELSGILTIPLRSTAVPKPRTGMVVLADGVNWNPGAGAGVYAYYGGAWNKLG